MIDSASLSRSFYFRSQYKHFLIFYFDQCSRRKCHADFLRSFRNVVFCWCCLLSGLSLSAPCDQHLEISRARTDLTWTDLRSPKDCFNLARILFIGCSPQHFVTSRTLARHTRGGRSQRALSTRTTRTFRGCRRDGWTLILNHLTAFFFVCFRSTKARLGTCNGCSRFSYRCCPLMLLPKLYLNSFVSFLLRCSMAKSEIKSSTQNH